MLTIDGSQGEGGGQVLRTSLALSLITSQAFRLTNVRARRPKPGLMRQHLTAVLAAQQVGQAEVTGAVVGSREITFRPGRVLGGTFTFSVGTAGSATLVAQTVLPALMLAPAPSSLALEGGTHNTHAPPFDFLERTYLPILRRMGPRVVATLDRPGFYPAGGGRFRLEVQPSALRSIDLDERGETVAHRAVARVASLPKAIADRELRVLSERLGWDRSCLRHERVLDADGPGNVVLAEIESRHVTEVFTGFGERGVRAETVAGRLADEVTAYLASGAAVGQHLADQLLLPFALAGGGSFRTVEPSQHARTQADVVRAFLGVETRMGAMGPNLWRVDVAGG
ncbi:MAG: RNA 3'-terminal phosphate cyclase [Deltaproteobacteria bacterium HGW-Deltaproteobacteria-20]|jgi:RNA 3'-terminal phosphate cyclase (ATP)|nr:MAG: RNA 3'-terminal phosphate cyclase [Deltaproteobacteria bacterium HGW-Deltaproteobacteria-20]